MVDCDLLYSFFRYSICNPLIFIVRKNLKKYDQFSKKKTKKDLPTYSFWNWRVGAQQVKIFLRMTLFISLLVRTIFIQAFFCTKNLQFTPAKEFRTTKWLSLGQFLTKMRQSMTKPTKWPVRPANTPISLGICPVWSESSLCAQRIAKDPRLLHADSEGWSDWLDALADQSLCWLHMWFCWFCHAVPQIADYVRK